MRQKTHGPSFGQDASQAWLDFLEEQSRKSEGVGREPASFSYIPLQGEADWLPVAVAAHDGYKPVTGSVMMVSENAVALTRAMVQQGQRSSGRCTLHLDTTYKISVTGGRRNQFVRNRLPDLNISQHILIQFILLYYYHCKQKASVDYTMPTFFFPVLFCVRYTAAPRYALVSH